MEYISIKEAAEKWGCSLRNVQRYCSGGLVSGAVKWGRAWMIPSDAEKPKDNRNKDTALVFDMPMPRKSVFLDMTNLYHTYGKADECAKALENQPEAQMLFSAEIAYSRGEVAEVEKYAKYFLNNHSGMFAVLGGGMLLAQCAMWNGNIDLWYKAKQHIYEAPVKNDNDRELIELTIAAIDSMVRRTDDFPAWFLKGNFEKLPHDALPAARIFYVKYLMIDAHRLAVNEMEFEGVEKLGLMRVMPYIIEPMISQVMADKTVLPELYLRLICAVAYHNTGDKESATEHIDRAIKIALADNLLGVLAEHRRHLDYLLDERLAIADEAALNRVKELHKVLFANWNKLHNLLMGRKISDNLSLREREVAKLAAFGLSNAEIADRLKISINSVKSAIAMAMNKTGEKSRAALGAHI